jgi:hypothetical protein
MSAVRRRNGALIAAVIALVTACGTTRPPALTSTSTLLSDALTRMQAATTYHVLMSYTQDFGDFSVDLHIRLPNDAYGMVTVDGGAPLQVIQTGDKLYVQGQEFVSEYGGSRDGRLFGSRWILSTPDLLRLTVLDLPNLTAILSAVLKADFEGTRTDHVAAATESTAKLTAAYGSLYIMELPPHALVKFESSNGFLPVQGFSNVKFEIFGYDDPVDVQVPTNVANPNDPSTLPPDYSLAGKWSWLTCDFSSCGFKGTVVNKGGAYPDSPSTFQLKLTQTNGALIDQCSGRVPVVANGKSVSISCRASGQGWRNWSNSHPGTYFYGQLYLVNPAYDG